MKCFQMLKNHAVSAILVGVITAATANVSHAQTSAGAQGGSTAQQTPPGWNKAEPARGGWLSSIFGSSSASDASDQAGSSPGWSAPREDYGSCRHSAADEEDFVCKLARIFWGPDRPRGPNRDMDENISAGGAGG